MFTKAFWLGTADRSVKSAAQALILLWGGDTVFNLFTISPVASLGVAGGAAALSLLTSLVSAPFGDGGSSSFLPGAS